VPADRPSPTAIQALDPNLAVRDPQAGLHWYDIRHLGVEGRGWADTESVYDRLPSRARGAVPDPVWQLSHHSAGLCVRFVTDSPALSARWRLRTETLAMHHMPATGVSGLDLYVDERGRWRWAGIGVAAQFPVCSTSLVSGVEPRRRHYLLYLPLYNGVEQVELGLPSAATLAPAPPWPTARPLCFYGSSIVQGGCASRPGMAYPALLQRRLQCPVINLGFSGSARMEPALADLLAELDPAAYVLDPLPNMDAALVRERAAAFVRRLLAARPGTPIVVVENITYQEGHLVPDRAARTAGSNAAWREIFEALRGEARGALHSAPGGDLLGHDDEATVDGTHPTDLGFLRMADALEPVLRRVLGPGGR
jgi:hypothetical protein